MSVKIRVYGSFKEYTGGKGEVEVPAQGTLREALRAAGIPPELAAMTLVNEVPQPKDYRVRDGDVVLVVAVLGGG